MTKTVEEEQPTVEHEGWRIVEAGGAHGGVCTCGVQSPPLPSKTAADDWWILHLFEVGVLPVEDVEEA